MMIGKLFLTAAISVTSLAIFNSTVTAQDMQSSYEKCLKIKDDAERLKCFDSLNKNTLPI